MGQASMGIELALVSSTAHNPVWPVPCRTALMVPSAWGHSLWRCFEG